VSARAGQAMRSAILKHVAAMRGAK
jgi:hypothetical protein